MKKLLRQPSDLEIFTALAFTILKASASFAEMQLSCAKCNAEYSHPNFFQKRGSQI